MEHASNLRSNEQFIDELRDCSSRLVENLQESDFESASELIQRMVEARDKHLFNSIGQLTRALHEAIVNFNVDGDLVNNKNNDEISDASDRLNYVINLTQNAAEKTMDRVEVAAPLAAALRSDSKLLKSDWERLRRKEISKSEFAQLYERIDEFWQRIDGDAEQLHGHLQDILLEQGYQDLTGQVLKKVIGLVKDVESKLINLMRIAGQVEQITGVADEGDRAKVAEKAAELNDNGPQIHKEVREDCVSSQDDVDDLLSSLGF